MKKSLLSTFLLLLVFPAFAQDKYFHELKGMEDSTGTTHLFYRLFEQKSFQCSEENGGQLLASTYNNIYHYDSQSLSDSVEFGDFFSPWCLTGIVSSNGISDYDFYNNDPSQWIIQTTDQGCIPFPITDFSGRKLEIPFTCITKQNSITKSDFDSQTQFVVSNKADSLYYNYNDGTGFRVAIKENFSPSFDIINEESYGLFYSYMDSVETEYGVKAIHPNIDSLFYSINESGHLLVSEKFSSAFELSDATASYYKLAFDSDTSVLYSIVTFKEDEISKKGLKKSENFGKTDSWELLDIPENLDWLQYLATDSGVEGILFISDSKSVFKSDNYGESFELLIEMNTNITGLYKKPSSDILYVLTREELFEVKNGVATSLEKLPVSSEYESIEIPNSVTLHQNYPNPFNPSTTISFELDRSARVTLSVFDALGRTISTLVNEKKPTGFHQVTFNASSLSSGIYFYRLESEGFIQTKRFALIK